MKQTLSLLCLMLLASSTLATPYYVSSLTGDDTKNGTSWALAVKTISNGVAKATAANGDVVWVSNGTYTVTAEISIPRGITVQSTGGMATVNGNYPITTNRCFNLNHANAVVDGFLITNGYVTTASSGGGGVFISAGTLRNCVISGNIVSNTGIRSGGGGVYINRSGGYGILDTCVIAGNSAYPNAGISGGGGVWIGDSTAMSTIKNCTISDNRVVMGSVQTGGGGAVYWASSGLMTNCTVSNNTVNGYCNIGGGGLYLSSYATVDTCRIVANFSGNNGGGVVVDQSTLGNLPSLLINCLIRDNSSLTNGGGVYLSKGGWLLNCQVISNRAGIASVASIGDGGGVRASTTNDIVRGGTISSNYAEGVGGGFYGFGGGVLQDCTISDNTCNYNSTGGGGGIGFGGNGGRAGYATNCTIRNNINVRGSYGGGGINFVGAGAAYNCLIYSNRANTGGGVAFTIGSGWTGQVVNCSIFANASTNGPGGGVYISAATANAGILSNCTIAGNTASGAGGGVANSATRQGRLYNCLIASNTAVTDGGGIYNLTTLELYNCTIATNQAARAGGLINDNGATLVMVNSILYFNSRTNTGAAWVDYYLKTAVSAFTNCCSGTGVGTPTGTNNITADPKFIDRANGNFRLAGSSPCLNAGLNQGWMGGTLDLDGKPRVDQGSGIVDMGCYEYVFPAGTLIQLR